MDSHVGLGGVEEAGRSGGRRRNGGKARCDRRTSRCGKSVEECA